MKVPTEEVKRTFMQLLSAAYYAARREVARKLKEMLSGVK